MKLWRLKPFTNPSPVKTEHSLLTSASFAQPNLLKHSRWISSSIFSAIIWTIAWQVSAEAQELTIDRQITGINHYFEPPNEMFGMPGRVVNEITFDTAGLSNVDLDQYKNFRMRLISPAGKKIIVNHNTPYRSRFEIIYKIPNANSIASVFRSGWRTFEGFEGVLPTTNYTLFYINNGFDTICFHGEDEYEAGNIVFSSMSYSFNVPSGLSTTPSSFDLTSGSALQFSYNTYDTIDPGPFVAFQAGDIQVEQPTGTVLAAGGSVSLNGTLPGQPTAAATFVVKNTGSMDLLLSDVTVSGAHASDFSINKVGMAGTIAPNGSTSFSVTFNPSGAGARTATLHIQSSDLEESSFDLTLTGTGLDFTADTDGDGLNDGAEFQWSALGLDWQVSQPSLVNSFLSDANRAGLFSTSQVQALHVGTPLIQRDQAGQFTLSLGLQKSATLQQGSFQSYSFDNGQMSVNDSGKLEFRFTSEDDASFFRLQVGDPAAE